MRAYKGSSLEAKNKGDPHETMSLVMTLLLCSKEGGIGIPESVQGVPSATVHGAGTGVAYHCEVQLVLRVK